MDHFAATKHYGNLHLETMLKEFPHTAFLNTEIVLIDVGPEFDFFQLGGMLMFSGGFLLSCLLQCEYYNLQSCKIVN